MEEFIFGTIAIDDLKLAYQRTSRSGIQHAHELAPKDPKPGHPVTISIRVAPGLTIDHVVCYYTLDGSKPIGSRGQASNGFVIPCERVDDQWDTFFWGYITHWQAILPPQPEDTTVRYRIGAWYGDGVETFADWPDVKATTDRTAAEFFRGKPLKIEWIGDPLMGTTFTYHVDRLVPPQWGREAVFYQIFVDRFYPGRGADWSQTDDLKDFFGGTLWGVTEKLDYIEGLGATCIWLSPIFPSPTTHGYDATDYRSVEPRMGGDDALNELVASAHERGIRIVLDLVCNHISNKHPIFVDARKNQRSRYRKWFFFDDRDVEYRSYFGVATMPVLNLANEDAKAWMIDIARFWLREFDVDGYRLDHANGPGPSFWPDFWTACKEEKPDCFCFGEIVEPANVLRRYVGRLDGTLDFLFTDAIRRTFGHGTYPEAVFEQFLQGHRSYFDEDFLMLTFIDNHDMDRFLFIAGQNKEVLRRVASIQMQLPGPPIIYYGTEVGLSQTVSKSSETGLEANRIAMVWDDRQDRDLLAFYQEMIADRVKAKPGARRGSKG
jgi:cyclomaltodextrinase